MSVVNETVRSAAGLSGGSRVSTSLMPAAYAVTEQAAPCGREPVGWSVTVDVVDPLMVKGIAALSQSRAKEATVAVTGSLKVKAGVTDVLTWVALVVGDVDVTLGAASLGVTWTWTSPVRHWPGPVT